jgi:hypothetical protein
VLVKHRPRLLHARRLSRLAGAATARHGFSFGSTKPRCRS